jgi:hypothetical protein
VPARSTNALCLPALILIFSQREKGQPLAAALFSPGSERKSPLHGERVG